MILCLSIENDTTTNYKCFILLENANSTTASVFVVGTDGVCSPSDGHCNGYLDPGKLYRYIIRIHIHTNISLKYIFTIYLANIWDNIAKNDLQIKHYTEDIKKYEPWWIEVCLLGNQWHPSCYYYTTRTSYGNPVGYQYI